MSYDRYAFLLPLCGTAAFRLPPPPGGCLDEDLPDPENPFAPIPDHLLSKYLCFDTTIPPPDLPTSSSSTSLVKNASHHSYPNLQHNVTVHHQHSQCPENLPLCVVNYQASPPETQNFCDPVEAAGDLWDQIPYLLLSEIKELALWHTDCGLDDNDTHHIVSVMTRFRKLTFASDYTERLLCRIKELALWHEGNAVLADYDIQGMLSVMKKFRNLAFSTKGWKSTVYESYLREPSRKKQRLSQAKSKTLVVSSSCFIQCNSSNADAANYTVVDLDDPIPRKSKEKENDYQVGSKAYLRSGCSSSVFGGRQH